MSYPIKLGNCYRGMCDTQFAVGMCHIPEKNQIVISYGENDCESALAFYNVDDIFATLFDI